MHIHNVVFYFHFVKVADLRRDHGASNEDYYCFRLLNFKARFLQNHNINNSTC